MYKCSYLFLVLVFFCFQANAQSGDNQLTLGADAGVAINEYYQSQFPAGFGVTAKGLYGVGQNNQVSLSAGYTFFPMNSNIVLPTGDRANFAIIPIMAGLRFNFDNFFFEPQAGIAIYREMIRVNDERFTSFENNFVFAGEFGYQLEKIEISVRYQHSGPAPNHMGMVALRASYKIPLGFY